jgi:hypothetical protein
LLLFDSFIQFSAYARFCEQCPRARERGALLISDCDLDLFAGAGQGVSLYGAPTGRAGHALTKFSAQKSGQAAEALESLEPCASNASNLASCPLRSEKRPKCCVAAK